MSADNITQCPKCGDHDYYNDDRFTLREYYEVGIHKGKFMVDYGSSCDECGYEYEYKVDIPLEIVKEPVCIHDLSVDGHTILMTHDIRTGYEYESVATCTVCKESWRHPLSRRKD